MRRRRVRVTGCARFIGSHLCERLLEQAVKTPVGEFGYASSSSVPTVGLRYFTAYGPRQRPDLALWRVLNCALEATPFPLNGEGRQIRDFTFVGGAVEGTLAAARLGHTGAVYRVGGGNPVAPIDAMAELGSSRARRG